VAVCLVFACEITAFLSIVTADFPAEDIGNWKYQHNWIASV